MSYLAAGGLVPFSMLSNKREVIVDARAKIGDFLDQLRSQPKFQAGTKVMKILPSNDSTFTGSDIAMSMVNKPTVWAGSNVISWPAGQLAQYEAAWAMLTAYVGMTKLQFARNLSSIPLAIARTTELLGAVDEQMAKDGLPVPRKGIGIYLGLAALVGVAVYFGKRKAKLR